MEGTKVHGAKWRALFIISSEYRDLTWSSKGDRNPKPLVSHLQLHRVKLPAYDQVLDGEVKKQITDEHPRPNGNE